MSTNLSGNLVDQTSLHPLDASVTATCRQASPSQAQALPMPTTVESYDLTLQQAENYLFNRLVSVQVTGPGWILGTAVALMKFMAKLTGSELRVTYLQVG